MRLPDSNPRNPELRVCAKMNSDFGGSATGPEARPEGGSVSAAIVDRPRNEAGGPVPPRPAGLGGFGSLVPRLRESMSLQVYRSSSSGCSCRRRRCFGRLPARRHPDRPQGHSRRGAVRRHSDACSQAPVLDSDVVILWISAEPLDAQIDSILTGELLGKSEPVPSHFRLVARRGPGVRSFSYSRTIAPGVLANKRLLSMAPRSFPPVRPLPPGKVVPPPSPCIPPSISGSGLPCHINSEASLRPRASGAFTGPARVAWAAAPPRNETPRSLRTPEAASA